MKEIENKKENRILSLGFRTEMIFHQFDGIITNRENYMVVKTPSMPGFFFGNFILFFEAPKTGYLYQWKSIFQNEFQDSPDVKHYTFLWDSPSVGVGDTVEFENEGFNVDFSVVLTARSVHLPPKASASVEVRVITSDNEWKDVVDAQIRSKEDEYDIASYRQFKEKQMYRYRVMSEQGLGNWFGAYLDGKLVADLGLYKDGTIGRFQSVETDPDYRRQGVCGRLVYESAQYGFKEMGLSKLVMVADENYHAAKIYKSVGFRPAAKEYSAFWWNKSGKK